MPAHFSEETLFGDVIDSLSKWREKREVLTGDNLSASQGHSRVSESAGFDEEIRNYGRKAETLHASLPVAGFATRLRVPIDIEEICVPLRVMLDLRGVDAECFADSAHAERVLCGRNAGAEISLPEAFEQAQKRGYRNILILGDPGSGKTTHLKRVLLYCLRNGPAGIGLPGDMLPVFLPLRNLKNLEKGFEAFIEGELFSPHLKTPTGFGDRMLRRGNLLYLLDGLDEVADLDQREQVAQWIVATKQADPTCRFVVTCRFTGYSPTVRMSADFLEMHLRPLTEEQVAAFVNNWYRVVEKGLALDPDQAEGIARERAEKLVNRLKEPDFRARRVFELTRHPYDAIRRRMADRAAAAEKDVLFNEVDEYELVRIPAGSFKMGSPLSEEGRWNGEGPQREVLVPAFFLGRYPVTNAQYARYLKAKPNATEPAYWTDRQFNQPLQLVIGVSWNDANEYARWTGLRLPSEAEWEYACRAGTSTRFYTGSKDGDLKRAGWYSDNSEAKLHPVGEKEPNAFGLYDMHGNIWEWVEDDYHEDYEKPPVDVQSWIEVPRGAERVVRGGSWNFGARHCRSAARDFNAPDDRFTIIGFRLARPGTLGP